MYALLILCYRPKKEVVANRKYNPAHTIVVGFENTVACISLPVRR